jgi:Matrixin
MNFADINPTSSTRRFASRLMVFVAAFTLSTTAHAAGLKYWVEPCTNSAESGCKRGDPELAQWAMEAWQAASGGKLQVERTSDKESAIIKFYWVSGRTGLYGETRGGEVYVRPDPGQGLQREAVTYLTCVHEAGHALGLPHTANFDDIMYNFQYGGDIAEYFGRYVRKLGRREDIRKYSGISENDRKRLLAGR